MLSGVPCQLNPELPGTKNSYWLPTVIMDKSLNFDREAFFSFMKKNSIDSRPFFYPISSLPMFEKRQGNVVSYDIYERGINLPSYHDLKKDDAEYVVNCLNNFLYE